MKKVIRLLLLLTLAVSAVMVAGCGKKEDPRAVIDKNAIYKETPVELDVPEDININNFVVGTEKIYFDGSFYDNIKEESHSEVYSADLDGKNIKSVRPFEGQGWVERCYAGNNGNLIVTYNTYFEDDSDPDNYIYENHNYIALYDKDLNKIKESEITDYGIQWIQNMKVLKSGKIFIVCDNQFFLLDENLSLVKQATRENMWVNNCFETRDGLYVSYWSDSALSTVVTQVNTDNLEFGNNLDLPFDIERYTIVGSNEEYDILLMDNTCVYGFKAGETELKTLFNLVDSDIDTTGFNTLVSLSDGSFIGAYGDWSSDRYKLMINKYTKVNPEDVVEKKVLTLGVTYLNQDMRRNIVQFNKSNEKYRIKIIDYSTYNTDEDYGAGQKKLNSDIASGQAPDIIMNDDPTTIKNHASKGLFVDLHKFLDKDETVNIADIFPNLISAYEMDGKLYEIAPSFYVETLAGTKQYLAGRQGWTMEEMVEFEKSLPEGTSLFPLGMSRDSLLSQMLYINGNQYIDYAKGSCNFDSDEFKKLLEYSAKFPKEDEINYDDVYNSDYEAAWRSGKVVLTNLYFSSAESYVYTAKGILGGDPVIVGFPSADRNGSVMMSNNSMSISSKSANAEGAWEFVRFFLTDKYQSTIEYNIPASMKRFDEMLKEGMERPHWTDPTTGEVEYYDNTYYIGGTEIVIDPLTQAEVDQLKAMVLNTNKTYSGFSEDIMNIITEETEPFYAGQKSVDDVCSLIQSRVSIYLKEQQ